MLEQRSELKFGNRSLVFRMMHNSADNSLEACVCLRRYTAAR